VTAWWAREDSNLQPDRYERGYFAGNIDGIWHLSSRQPIDVHDQLRPIIGEPLVGLTVELEHAGHHFRMQIGYFPDGTLGKVFLNSAKQSSALDAVAADAAILISLLLQHGAAPTEIGHALRRVPDGATASLIGAVVDRAYD
jgi:hypothetical protein